MKTGWGHIINESGADELFAPNTLAPQVLIAEEGPTLLEALSEKLDDKFAVIETAHIQDAAIKSAKIAEAAIQDAHIAVGEISTAKIKDLTVDILNAVVAEIEEVTAGTVETNELYAQVIMAVSAEIRRVTAGTVETNELYANIIQAVCADLERIAASEIRTHVLQAVSADINRLSAGEIYTAIITAVQADIDMLAAGRLYTALANISKATIKDADIDFAQVKDLIAGDAIITKGIGEQLFITRLAVNEANMVSMTTGELILKGVDGSFHTVIVREDGSIDTVKKPITNNNIDDASILGGKIIENSITATQLNVQEIFANSALIGAITANNLNVGSLFTSTAFIGALRTHLIESDYLSIAIQDSEEMFGKLKMYFDFTATGLVIKQPGSEFSTKVSDTALEFWKSGQRLLYVENTQVYAPKVTITDELTIGRHRWQVGSDGGLNLVWIE